MNKTGRPPAPALLTGTSSEYLGRRPPPRLLRSRPVVYVFGPAGVGKTSVALRLAGEDALRVKTLALDMANIGAVVGRWPGDLRAAQTLVLDGPVWLTGRSPQYVRALVRLIVERLEAGRRTFVVQSDEDGSASMLMSHMPAGSSVVLGLRFPRGDRGRRRFARRMCDALELPRIAARGTAALDPWHYDAVIQHLRSWTPDGSS